MEEYLIYVYQTYGLTQEQYWALYNKQNGCCAICDQKVILVIDHSHDGKSRNGVRGLLCYYCNGVLGRIEKFPEILGRIRRYLRRTNRLLWGPK